MINTLLFDLDGTLFETASGIHRAVNKFFKIHDLEEMDLHTVNRLIGFGANYFVDGLEESTKLKILTLQKNEEQFLDIYSQTYIEDSNLMPHLIPFLQSWGGKLAVVSNKRERFVKGLIDHSHLKDFAWRALIGGDTYAEKKPSALPLIKAMEICESLPRETVLIGDGLADAHGSRAAGIPFIGVSFGGSPSEVLHKNGAKEVIDDFRELDSAIKMLDTDA